VSRESLRRELRARLAAEGLAANRRLGQHFMVDAGALDAVVDAAASASRVREAIEIGPGTGLLTRKLLAAGYRVTAIEIDRGLHALLADDFADEITAGSLHLIHGDALASKQRLHPAFAAERDRVVIANLPYDVSIPLLLDCGMLPRPPVLAAVTVQREAGRRLCSGPGEAAWGASAAIAGAGGRGEIIRRLPPSCFEPRPRVESVLLRWRFERPVDPAFAARCRALFAGRRKRLVRALRDTGCDREAAEKIVREAGLDPGSRVGRLGTDELQALHREAVAEEQRNR